jgi:glycosyltransferase involved in cell wall biosynthesis
LSKLTSTPEAGGLHVAYLAVEATRQGHAAYAHVHEIAGGLRRLGIQVDVFEPRDTRATKTVSLPLRLLEQLRIQVKLFARWTRYDAIYVRAHYTAFPTAAMGRLTGRPVVQEVNGPFADVFIAYPWTRSLRPLLSWLLRQQLRWASAVITVTPALRAWLGDQVGRYDAEVIPNGANIDLFSPDRTTARALPEKFIVFFGALTPWQGVETLLAAFERHEWPDDVHLVILGDGALSGLVSHAAGRSGRLHWFGSVPYTEVGPIVARARAGVVPKNGQGNRQETGLFPLKLFEIVSCGIPAIVTDFPGQADFVRDYDCGLVVPPESPQAIAGAVRQLTEAPQAARDKGARGRAAIATAHSWTHRSEHTARVLRDVLYRGAPAEWVSPG